MGLFVTFVADVLSDTDNRISLSDVTHDRRSLAVNSNGTHLSADLH